MIEKTDDMPKIETVDINKIAASPRENSDRPSSFIML